MQIHLASLGCRLNEAELETWSHAFQASGHELTNAIDTADAVVLNTCAVTAQAVRKSRQLIQKVVRQNPSANLIVSGCYPSLPGDQQSINDELLAMGVDLVITNPAKDRLPQMTLEHLNHSGGNVEADQQGATVDASGTPLRHAIRPGTAALFERNRQRAFIKIQDGCRYKCTYCVVTLARGEERSRQISDIIDEINRLHCSGVQEIVLTGVHVGGYGSDIGSDLYTLVKHILSDTAIPRIRFASVEPWDLPPVFFDLFENNRLMQHMHLPLQSGSDSVLKRMARRCKTHDFRDLVTHIRSSMPHFGITTDIIVGFPGETDAEWADSLAFIESMQFSHIHIFSYSGREGTHAAKLPNQVHGTIKKARSQALHELAAKCKLTTLKENVGQQAEVLWETGRVTDNGIRHFGYTANYLRVQTLQAPDDRLDNLVTRVKLGSVTDDGNSLHIDSIIERLAQKEGVTPRPIDQNTTNGVDNAFLNENHDPKGKVFQITPVN